MTAVREPIYVALFARLAGIAGFVTASRRLRHWADVAPAEQPALFLVQKGETVEPRTGLPPRRTLAVELMIYVHAANDRLRAPMETLNPLVDAIEAALAPDPGNPAQTLGGLVSHVRLEGEIETDEGALGAQAVAILPLRILIP